MSVKVVTMSEDELQKQQRLNDLKAQNEADRLLLQRGFTSAAIRIIERCDEIKRLIMTK